MSSDNKVKRSYQDSEEHSRSNKRAYRNSSDRHHNRREYGRDSSNRRDYSNRRGNKQHHNNYKAGNSRDEFDRYFDDMGYFSKKFLDSAICIDKIDRSSFTKWDMKPSRFEKFSGDQAKSLGLFPMPGIVKQKYVDEKIVKSILENELKRMEVISREKSVMNPRDSRNSCLLLVHGVNDKISDNVIIDYFKSFLKSLEVFKEKINEDSELSIKFKRIHNNNILLLEFDDYQFCTACFSLNGFSIPMELDFKFQLTLSRPKEYVVPWEDDKISNNDESSQENEFLSDSIHKLTINNIPTDTTEKQLTDTIIESLKIEKNQIQYLNFLFDKEHKSKGIALLKFKKNNLSHGENLFEKAIREIPEIKISDQKLRLFKTCEGFKSNENLNFRGLINRAVIAKGTPPRKRTNVLQLFNLVNIAELLLLPSSNAADYNTIKETLNSIEIDIRKKIKRFQSIGKFEIKVPLIDESVFNKRQDLKKIDLIKYFNGFGKIFIKFDSMDDCEYCLEEFNGIKYFGRVILVSYFSEDDFNNDLF